MADTVVAIDDNPGFLRALSAVLSEGEPHFTVTTADDAHTGLFLLQGGLVHPRFLVLDFHLPDMDAPAVLGVLRRDSALMQLPVLVLTQADWHADEVAALASGATRFAVKPSRVVALRELVLSFWRECVQPG